MANEETITELEERLRLAEEALKKQKEGTEEYRKQELYIKGINEELKKTSDYYNSHFEAAKKLADAGKDLLDVKQKELQLSVSLAEKAVEKAIKDGESADELEKLVLKLKEAEEAYENLNRARSSGKALANLLGFDESNKNSLTYQIFANPKQVIKGFTDEVEDAGGAVQSVMLSTVMKIQEMTVGAFFAYDQASVGIAKIAGYNQNLLKVLENTSRGATAYGISFEQAGRAIEGLYTNLNTFSTLNQGAKEQLTISAAKLDRLGIASQESAKQIGTLTQIMGMSEVQAGKTSEELAGFALAIGKPPQQVAQDFAAASNQLAAYGNNMVNVFKDLEIQSKATGVAVGDLIAIAEKFQTFEGAAQAAGKLNAALGGGFINSMELLEASAENPAKAIDLLRTRLDEAGLSFNQMSFYEQKMIADAAGFKTIEEASRVLSMTNAEAERAAKADAERANEQKLLNEAVQKSIPIQEKLQLLMANLAIVMAEPIDKLSMFISKITWLIDNVPYLGTVLGVIIASFVALKIIGSIGFMLQSLASAFGIFNAAATVTAPAATAAAGGVETFGAAGLKAAPGITAFGGSLFTVLGPIALVAAAMALMYAGIGYLVKSFVELFKVLANTDSIADSLFTLSLAMGAVGLIFTNPFVMGGLLVFSAALAGIVFTLNKLDKDKSFNFATITKSIAELNVKTTTGPNNAMKQTGELITAINSFSLSKDNTAGLEKILKAAIPQQQQAGSTYSPTIIVKIGDKQIRNLVVEVVEPMMGATPTIL